SHGSGLYRQTRCPALASARSDLPAKYSMNRKLFIPLLSATITALAKTSLTRCRQAASGANQPPSTLTIGISKEVRMSSRNLSSGFDGQLDRRDLLKLGGGAVAAAALAAQAPAQEMAEAAPRGPAPHAMRLPGEIAPFTGPGYKYTANRLAGNGP